MHVHHYHRTKKNTNLSSSMFMNEDLISSQYHKSGRFFAWNLFLSSQSSSTMSFIANHNKSPENFRRTSFQKC